MKTQSDAFLRKRRFFLVLPLLVLPFLMLAFWSLGGGKGTGHNLTSADPQTGLNLQLPEAQLKQQQHQDKLSHYDEALQKSRQSSDASIHGILQRMGFGNGETAAFIPGESEIAGADNPLLQAENSTAPATTPAVEATEEKINQKLAQLEQAIQPTNNLSQTRQNKPRPSSFPATDSGDRFSQEVDRLEMLMRSMGSGSAGSTADPEMQQLESMLERILDIQHPERVRERLATQANETKQQTFALQISSQETAFTLLKPSFKEVSGANDALSDDSKQSALIASEYTNAFYGLEDSFSQGGASETGNILEAAIHETQTLMSGSTVKMRLLQDVYLNGKQVDKGSLLYGTCRVNGERLHIEVTSVRARNHVLPVALAAFDLDGQAGLYIPGALTRDAAKQGADRAVNQSLQLSALNPSIGAQAASAGIEAAKGLLSRQARQIKVTVNAGHRLLLRDQNTRQ